MSRVSAAHLTVQQIGSMAAAVLCGGAALETIAVFERSFYVRDASGRLACFVRGDLPPGPLNLVAAEWPDDPRNHLTPGDCFVPVADGVLASGEMTIQWNGSAVWTPPPFPPFTPDSLRRGLDALRSAAVSFCPKDSVAMLLLPGIETDGMRRILLDATAHGIAGLRAWTIRRDDESFRQLASLIGLGPGLTPSGDDVLGGFLLGLRATGRADLADSVSPPLLETARTRTNALSLAHLEAAAAGMGAAPVHALLSAVLRGGEGVPDAAKALDRIGHTSGWDAALGIAVSIGH